MRHTVYYFSKSNTRGFSLIELLVVMAIVGVLSTLLIFNFRSAATNPTARRQTAAVVVSDIRRVQSMALSGSTYDGASVCGYGVSWIDDTSYRLFVRKAKLTPPTPCSGDALAKKYLPGNDVILSQQILSNQNMRFKASFDDVYITVPYGKTYIKGVSEASTPPSTIEIISTGQTSPGTVVSVYTTGKIDVTN